MKRWGLCRLEGELLPGPTRPRTLSVAEVRMGATPPSEEQSAYGEPLVLQPLPRPLTLLAHIHGSPHSPPQSSLSLAPACCC